MKKPSIFISTCLTAILVTSCATNPPAYQAQLAKHQAQEDWLNHINLDANRWRAHADNWFYTDTPRDANEYNSNAPAKAGITAMLVRVPDFTNIVVSGSYKIEIVGRQMHNSLYILGSNEAARHVATDITDSTLNIHPATDCKHNNCGSQAVIVRIGVRELGSLTVNGKNFVEGKDITSSRLSVKSTANTEILLDGIMNVTNVTQTGPGTINLIGAYAPVVDVNDSDGNVNISGHVGLRNVNKQGGGNINVIGLDTDSLTIRSSGSGTIALAGYGNLRKVTAKQNSKIYLYWVNSTNIYATLSENAQLGLAGSAKNLDIQLTNSARFSGRYLHTDTVYVTTRQQSHANVYPQTKIFANAADYSSVYFFGSPNVVSRYTNGGGIVVPIFSDAGSVLPTALAPPPYPATMQSLPQWQVPEQPLPAAAPEPTVAPAISQTDAYQRHTHGKNYKE